MSRANVERDANTTRVTLSRAELLHLADFAASVDDSEHVEFWDRLTNKLERAISRIDGTVYEDRKTPHAGESKPDDRPALCRACGWRGTVTKSSPCPTCGQKVNPLLWSSL